MHHDGVTTDGQLVEFKTAPKAVESEGIALIRELKELLAEAMDTHIYDQGNGEGPEDDCGYQAAVRKADHYLDTQKAVAGEALTISLSFEDCNDVGFFLLATSGHHEYPEIPAVSRRALADVGNALFAIINDTDAIVTKDD